MWPVVTIAAILSSKPLFTSPIDKREEARKARESFARARSDLLTDVAAFDACNAIKQQGARRQFCDQVSDRSTTDHVSQLTSRISSANPHCATSQPFAKTSTTPSPRSASLHRPKPCNPSISTRPTTISSKPSLSAVYTPAWPVLPCQQLNSSDCNKARSRRITMPKRSNFSIRTGGCFCIRQVYYLQRRAG